MFPGLGRADRSLVFLADGRRATSGPDGNIVELNAAVVQIGLLSAPRMECAVQGGATSTF